MTATDTTPTTALATTTPNELAPWEPKVTDLLERFPADQVNLLVPTMSIRQVNPYLVPDIELVKLSMIDTDGDIYHDSQMKDGHFAPTAKGLSKIRQVAGIDVIDSRRVDEGSDPDIVEWTVVIEMQLPSGQRVRQPGTKRIDLHQLRQQKDRNGKVWSDARLEKAREHLIANAETKAQNRALRSLLSLQGSMPKAAFSKPFAILRWVPNMNDADVRRRMLDNLVPAVSATYGPAGGRQLEAPEPIQLPPVVHEDDDDGVTEGAYVRVDVGDRDGPSRVASVDAATGEVSAEPDWFGAGSEASPTDLATRLRAVADANPTATGPATKEQREQLQEVLRGVSGPEAGTVLAALWDLGQLAAIQGRHAQAILEVGAAIGHERLVSEWRALAAELEAKEA